MWRRGRDSNPRRRGYLLNSFRDCRIQPLCHLSAVATLSGAKASIPTVAESGNARTISTVRETVSAYTMWKETGPRAPKGKYDARNRTGWLARGAAPRYAEEGV